MTMLKPAGWFNREYRAGFTNPFGHQAESAESSIFFDDFTSLAMGAAETWRPCDTWQDINAVGHFGGIAGNAFMLNILEGETNSPFEVTADGLRISAFGTPPGLVTAIEAIENPAPDWCGGYAITNSNVQTFTDGYFEFRMRLPDPGKGMFPALWLYGALGASDPNDKGCAEIDLFEVFGEADGDPFGINLHFRDNANAEARPSVVVGTFDLDTTGWHVYSLDKQASYLRFYYDGKLLATITGADATWFNDVELAIRMNLQMDADWFSVHPDGTTPDPMPMDIDYVRVRAAKPAATDAPATAPVLTVTDEAETSITLSRDYIAGADAYELEVSDDGSTGWAALSAFPLASYEHTGLADDETKFYRARATNAAGNGPWSDVVDGTTVDADLVPADWGSNIANWQGGLPTGWTLSGGRMVVANSNFETINLILDADMAAGVTYDISIDCIIGAGSMSAGYNGGGDPFDADALANGVNNFQQTPLTFPAPRFALQGASNGFELISISITAAS